MRIPWVPVLALLAGALLVAACSDREEGPATPTPVPSPTATPTQPAAGVPPERKEAVTDSPLFDARLDLAGRLGINPLDVLLRDVRHAGWDGCLGIVYEGEPCLEVLVAGYLAFFHAGPGEGAPYRYHFGGDSYVAVDFYDGELSDGIPVPPELRVDIHALLAAYARHDLALRLDLEPGAIAIAAIVPVKFPDGCMGFLPPGDVMCTEAIVSGAIVLLDAPGGERYRYHVADQGFIPVDFDDGDVTMDPAATSVAIQEAMREDLAARTGDAVDEISVVAFREVTWADGCLGVHRPGVLCTQVLVEGFFALLTVAAGDEYRYHGTGDRFIAASFEPADVDIGDPLPPEE